MDLVIVTGLMYTVVAALCLWHLVEKFVSAVKRGGEERVVAEEGESVVVVGGGGGRIRRRNENRVRFAEWCGSEMKADLAGGEGLGNVAEKVGGVEERLETGGVSGSVELLVEKSGELDCGRGVVVRDESGVEEKLEVESILESGEVAAFAKVVEIGGVVEKSCGGSGSLHEVDGRFEFRNKNIVSSDLNEEICSAQGGSVDELFVENEVGMSQGMDVEDGDGGRDEMEKHLKVEVADRTEECIRNIEGGVTEEGVIVDYRCKNEFEGSAEPKYEADRIGGVIEEENNVNEGCKNEFQEIEEPKVVSDRIIGMSGQGDSVSEGRKREFKETTEPKDVNFQIKDEVAEERFESIEEDDDWEGIEMTELYNVFTSAAAFFRKEEKCGMCNIGSEVKMQLYGLQKIVMEGPCREAQPMVIQMSARAKWNAWQRQGNMNPEDAMKQYIAIIAGIHPEWEEQKAKVDDQSENVEATNINNSDPDRIKPPESQRKKEITHNAEDIDAGTSSL